MRKLLLLLPLLLFIPARASATFTLVQSPENTACPSGNATCVITVASTGTGNLLDISAFYSSTATISSASGACPSWVHPSGTHGTDGSTFSNDMIYCLASTSGVTSISVTLSAAPTGAWHAQLREIHFTGPSVSVDAGTPNGANAFRTPATTAPAGVTFTISGANDAMVQAINPAGTCSAITTYTNIDTDGSGSVCSAVLLNSASGSPPTWTTTSGTACVSGIAFTEAVAAGAGGFSKERKLERLEL